MSADLGVFSLSQSADEAPDLLPQGCLEDFSLMETLSLSLRVTYITLSKVSEDAEERFGPDSFH